MYVPLGTFLVDSIFFQGPCSPPGGITVQVEGTVLASVDPSVYENGEWLMFEDINGLKLIGGGTFDASDLTDETLLPDDTCTDPGFPFPTLDNDVVLWFRQLPPDTLVAVVDTLRTLALLYRVNAEDAELAVDECVELRGGEGEGVFVDEGEEHPAEILADEGGEEGGEGRHYEGPGCLLPELKACWRTSWAMPKRMEVVQGRYRAARSDCK